MRFNACQAAWAAGQHKAVSVQMLHHEQCMPRGSVADPWKFNIFKAWQPGSRLLCYHMAAVNVHSQAWSLSLAQGPAKQSQSINEWKQAWKAHQGFNPKMTGKNCLGGLALDQFMYLARYTDCTCTQSFKFNLEPYHLYDHKHLEQTIWFRQSLSLFLPLLGCRRCGRRYWHSHQKRGESHQGGSPHQQVFLQV